MSHQYVFKRGDWVTIFSGYYNGSVGTVNSKVFQRNVEYPEELGAAYHVLLDAGKVVTVRVEQVTLRLFAVSPEPGPSTRAGKGWPSPLREEQPCVSAYLSLQR